MDLLHKEPVGDRDVDCVPSTRKRFPTERGWGKVDTVSPSPKPVPFSLTRTPVRPTPSPSPGSRRKGVYRRRTGRVQTKTKRGEPVVCTWLRHPEDGSTTSALDDYISRSDSHIRGGVRLVDPFLFRRSTQSPVDLSPYLLRFSRTDPRRPRTVLRREGVPEPGRRLGRGIR